MTKNFRKLIVVIASVAIPLGSAGVMGCNNRSAAPPEASLGSPPPVAVKVVAPTRQCLRRVVEQPGNIHADEETHLYARASGYVKKIHVDIGEKVTGPKYDASGKLIEPGQVLAEIDVPELREEKKQKVALARQADAEVEQTRKSLAAAEAYIDTVAASVVEAKALQARWESESKRVTKLVESGTLDLQARDETQNQLKAAGARVLSTEAAVRKAKADRDKAIADVDAAVARVDVAKAEVGRLDAMLAYAEVRAPYAAVVTARSVNTGDSVQLGGGKGDLLFTVAKLDPVRIVIAVPEADAEVVHEKAEVTLTIPALRDSATKGTIKRTSWALLTGARTLRAEIELPNKEGILRPGMYVYARIASECAECWTLPSTALAKQADFLACYQIEQDKTVRLQVQVGRANGEFTEVLRWKTPGSADWRAWTGKEQIAVRAAGLSEGQAVRVEAPTK